MCQACSRITEDCTGFDTSKCGRRIGVAYGLGLLSLFMICVPLGFETWFIQPIYYYRSSSGEYERVGTIECGLQTFTLTVDDDPSRGIVGYSIHDKLTKLIELYPGAHGSAFDKINTGGKQVLALVVPALLLLVTSYVTIGIYRFNKTPITSWWALGGVVSHALALVFLILAIIFYDSALYVGYSYLIFLTSGLMGVIAFLLQFGTTLMATLRRDQPQSWVRGILSAFFNFLAVCMACAGLATLAWIVVPDRVNDIDSLGMNGELMGGSLSCLTVSGAVYTIYKGFDTAGNYALGFGIPGVLAAVTAAGVGLIATTGRHAWHIYAFGLTGAGAGLLLCGVFFYARAIFMGWAFSLFTVAPFLSLVSWVLMMMVLVGGDSKSNKSDGSSGGGGGGVSSGAASVNSGASSDPYKIANTGPTAAVDSGVLSSVDIVPSASIAANNAAAADPYAVPAPVAAAAKPTPAPEPAKRAAPPIPSRPSLSLTGSTAAAAVAAVAAAPTSALPVPVSDLPPTGLTVLEAPPIPAGNPFDA